MVFDNGAREKFPEQGGWTEEGLSAHDTWGEQGFGNLPRDSLVQIPRELKRMGRGGGFRRYTGGREKTPAPMIPRRRDSVACVAVQGRGAGRQKKKNGTRKGILEEGK